MEFGASGCRASSKSFGAGLRVWGYVGVVTVGFKVSQSEQTTGSIGPCVSSLQAQASTSWPVLCSTLHKNLVHMSLVCISRTLLLQCRGQTVCVLLAPCYAACRSQSVPPSRSKEMHSFNPPLPRDSQGPADAPRGPKHSSLKPCFPQETRETTVRS